MDKSSCTTALSKPVFSATTVTPGNMCFTIKRGVTRRKEETRKKFNFRKLNWPACNNI
jgi:hypothetical protein